MRRPTIIEETTKSRTEAARCQWWRHNIAKLTRAELSGLTGYSIEAIVRFEAGHTSAGKPHTARALQRYRMACVGCVVNPQFNWGTQDGQR